MHETSALFLLFIQTEYSYTQLTDQPLELFKKGQFNRVPTIMVRHSSVYSPLTFPYTLNTLYIG